MFKKEMERRLKSIFGIEKVTFSAPSPDAPEQDTLFVEIDSSRPRPYGKDRISCKVTGKLVMYSQAERLTFGFFSRKLEQAVTEDSAPFIFMPEVDVAGSQARYQNIHERVLPFIFLYDAQYDPDRGSLTEIELSLSVGE